MPAPFEPRNTERARSLRQAATPAERHLWTALRASAQGAKFSRQMPFGPFFADSLCRDLKLVIELDGMSHETSEHYDHARDARMATQGYRVLRFANADVLGNLEGVAIVIRAAVLERAGDKSEPSAPRKRTEDKSEPLARRKRAEDKNPPAPLPLAGTAAAILFRPYGGVGGIS